MQRIHHPLFIFSLFAFLVTACWVEEAAESNPEIETTEELTTTSSDEDTDSTTEAPEIAPEDPESLTNGSTTSGDSKDLSGSGGWGQSGTGTDGDWGEEGVGMTGSTG